ncbi:MAG: patatin-like phospholipase family protein [Candidatus Paracaedimonas acanthamoebae]|uniref:Patatin-like phospholipase family protein n=1 Tax=Candidatus Paracaedimonas acanthamoebae TaxID=244581 RepID=A0A8J7PQW4_9PROT|nr:patatin-like phospholipase family protein [Candidatus Paracaedimonas acanthamoebae]
MKARQNPKCAQKKSKLKIYAATRLASLLLMGGAYGVHGNGGSLTEENRDVMPSASRMHSIACESSFVEGETSEPAVSASQVTEYKKDEVEYAKAVKDAWQVNKKLERAEAGAGSELEQQAQNLAQSIHHYEDRLEEAIDGGVQRAVLEEGISTSFSKKPNIIKKFITGAGSREEENILCLDGGGMRGVGTLTMLAALEMKTGLRTHQLFDRIYGTSTGGLAAILLARGLSANEVLDLYVKEGKVIFGRSTWDIISNPGGFLGATYRPEGLESVIKKYVGEAALSEVKVPVTVTSVDSKTGALKLLSSEDGDTKDVSMLEAGRATSAAPTYFPGIEVTTKKGSYTAIDGGVGYNNPATIAFEHARDRYKEQGRKVRINMLSLGTGTESFLQLNKNAGKLGFGNPGNIPGFFMGITGQGVEDTMARLHKKGKLQHYARIQFGLEQKVDLADYSELTLKKLQEVAWATAHGEEMSAFAKLLNKQKRDIKR